MKFVAQQFTTTDFDGIISLIKRMSGASGVAAAEMTSTIESIVCPDLGQTPPVVTMMLQSPRPSTEQANPCDAGYMDQNNELGLRMITKWYSTTSKQEWDV